MYRTSSSRRQRPPSRTPPARAPGRRFASRREGRRGLSMLEMILVLAVLVAVAAMVLPALQGPMSDQRLRKSADLVRAQLTKARVKAMQSGRLYVFRYDIATDRYGIEPWYGETDAIEASDTAQAAATTEAGQRQPTAGQEAGRDQLLGIAGQRLPAGITFFTGETIADVRTQDALAASPDAAAMTDGAAPPIVFYPDGTTTDARLVLTNERFFVEVSIRGLTGLTQVSDLLTVEELSTGIGATP